MSRPVAVLRPEPGNARTVALVRAQGAAAIALPLFAVRALDWEVPEPERFDALIATSANVFRHGGAGLSRLRGLPVHAVGAATAAAAREAGFVVVQVGESGAASLIAATTGVRRALHLAGREHTLGVGGIVAAVVAVYASEVLAIPPVQVADLEGSVALVQSARAGKRLATLLDGAGIARGEVAIAAISAAAADACGDGWQARVVAPDVSADSLVKAAIALAD